MLRSAPFTLRVQTGVRSGVHAPDTAKGGWMPPWLVRVEPLRLRSIPYTYYLIKLRLLSIANNPLAVP